MDTKDTSTTLTDPTEKAFHKSVNIMAEALEKMSNEDDVISKRQPQLAASLKEPFTGSSNIKRIVMGAYASDAIYDPLEEVDELKLWNLLDYIRPDDDQPLPPKDYVIDFYKPIITPRKDWPEPTYGWLSSCHMASCLRMFRQRAMRDPTPFHSSRIAFIDPYLVLSWVHDYKSFKPKGWAWSERYIKLFNGQYPADQATNKKWITDVDRLFVCHNINDNHWVALDIKMLDGQIDVYDSIQSLSDEKAIVDSCQPFSKMIPALLNHMIPSKGRKKKFTQFKVKRVRGIPQNENPGDCGVYTLKYIECLALGCNFEGICDDIIQKLREKLGAELYDEVPEPPNIEDPLNFGDEDDVVEDVTAKRKK